MAARRLLLVAAICTLPSRGATKTGGSLRATVEDPGQQTKEHQQDDQKENNPGWRRLFGEDVVEAREGAIEKGHEAAIEDLDLAIEQVGAATPLKDQSQAGSAHLAGSLSRAALEAALAAADQQNKALEAALAKAGQPKLTENQEPIVQGELALHGNLRASSKPAEVSGSVSDGLAAEVLRTQPLAEGDGVSASRDEERAGTDEWTTNSSEMADEESAMEKSLTDLIVSSKLSGTPFGKSVRHIGRLINRNMIPQVKAAHDLNQKHLDKLIKEMTECGSSKDVLLAGADKSKVLYLKMSSLHKSCRASEASKAMEKAECANGMKDKKRIKDLKCKEFGMNAKKYGDQQANRQIVKKGGSESTDSYVGRITATICGKYPPGGLGGAGRGGFLDVYLRSKGSCLKAAADYNSHVKRCAMVEADHATKKSECNSIQDQMDGASCIRATVVKDACQSYAGCFFDKKKAHAVALKMVKKEEKDRKREWAGLMRMKCLMKAFSDGDVYKSEYKHCRRSRFKSYDVSHLDIVYGKVPDAANCSVPNLYPTTAAYKLAEFAPLPALAKGKKDAYECSGVIEIPTTPRPGSPKTCECSRVTLNGPYSAGPLVKCSNCLDTRRSLDVNSCPAGTKLFSPRDAADWKTVLSSAGEVSDPHFIVDVTRPKNGCGDCDKKAMNSGPGGQAKQWRTSDGSPWFLRSAPYTEPNGNYHANCYLGILRPGWDMRVKFEDDNCKFHAKSYYCQLEELALTPKTGSPPACKCEQVVLTGPYSAGALIKCENCLAVRKSTQKNSCPVGTKLFSPASAEDWKTVLSSAQPLRNPNWIIDITRPQNGCGGCGRYAMNFDTPAQRTWRTADGTPWWLRSDKYSEPNGDYSANCYMDISNTPPNENSVVFNDKKCSFYSKSYYCQPVKRKKKQRM